MRSTSEASASSGAGRVGVRVSIAAGREPDDVRRHHRGWRFRRGGPRGSAVGGSGAPRPAVGGGSGLRNARVDPGRPPRRLADVVARARLETDRRGRGGPGDSLSAGPGDRRLVGCQCHDRAARRAGGLRRVGRAGQRCLELGAGVAAFSSPRGRPGRRGRASRARWPDRDPSLAPRRADSDPARLLRGLPASRLPRGRRPQPSRGLGRRPVPAEPTRPPAALDRDRLPAAGPSAAQPHHPAPVPRRPGPLRGPAGRRDRARVRCTARTGLRAEGHACRRRDRLAGHLDALGRRAKGRAA